MEKDKSMSAKEILEEMSSFAGNCGSGIVSAQHVKSQCDQALAAVDVMKSELDQVYEAIGLHRSQSISILLVNLRNMKHFSDLLSSVEHRFLMVPGSSDDLDEEDEGCEPDDECLVNKFGSTKEQYLKDFEAALNFKFGKTDEVEVPANSKS